MGFLTLSALVWFLGVPMALAGVALPFVETGYIDTFCVFSVVWILGNGAVALKIIASTE